MSEHYIGLMSGTSMDGIDAVLVSLSGEGPPRLLAARQNPYEPGLRQRLLKLCQQDTVPVVELLQMDALLGRQFARTALALLTETGLKPAAIQAIGSHGQTIHHLPTPPACSSLQIGDPNVIAELSGITTVADFRRRDMAAGGEGAPLVPAFHRAVFSAADKDRVIVNIGGIANITILPCSGGTSIKGFDTGPGNLLMDAWATQHLQSPMDSNGQWAASGVVDQALLACCLADPYFQRPPPKSTGREYFCLHWLEEKLRQHGGQPAAADIQATLCELSGATIATAIRSHAPHSREVLVCGGGVHNSHLLARLRAHLPHCTVRSTAAAGIDPDLVEAIAFAWLARQTLRGKPGNVPAVTGAQREVILGGIYQGRYKLQDTRYK
ncbi:MAG: anhydro-N-acetylmuramic acid kinase [Gammaproteobacteria bacterium]